MKKLFLAIAILALGAGAGYAQNNSATKPAQEKAKHLKKSDATAASAKPAISPAKTATTKEVVANKGKHHKKMKKEKAAGK